MKENIFHVYDLSEWKDYLPEIFGYAKGLSVWLFEGEMGAGKTTLIRKLGQYLGVQDNISSPTFGIVNEYEAAENKSIFHFDFYRISDPEEALDMGWEDYLEQKNAFCWVEWPERIHLLWPMRYLSLSLQLGSAPNERILSLKRHD